MTKNIYGISYNTPQAFSISSQQYVACIKSMISAAFQQDPTIVVHSDQEIQDKYTHGIVAMYNDVLIGNVNIYPTHMKPLDMLNNSNGQKISVGELGSVVIQPEFRGLGIGKQLTGFALQALGSSYDAVVSATVNDYMTHIFHDYGFHHIPFPKEYFEEGKLHLGPKMIGGVDEFVKKAKCFVLSSKDVQEYIVKILG